MKTNIDKSLILSRFKEVNNFNTDIELADYLGISRSTLSNWYKRNSLDYDLLFSKCEQIDINWLLTGNGSMLQNKTSILDASPVTGNRKTKDAVIELQRIPVFNLEATMGLIPVINGSTDDEKIIDYISLGMLPSCDGAISATGDSMYPLLKAGDLVAYKSVAVERNSIFFGEMYLLAIRIDETTTMKTIKFIHPSDLGEDYIKIVSHNQHHAPKDVHLNQIVAIGLVRASIRLHN
ncbi:helix-turn-helix domain-containing protein [Myroides sp. LJL115]